MGSAYCNGHHNNRLVVVAWLWDVVSLAPIAISYVWPLTPVRPGRGLSRALAATREDCHYITRTRTKTRMAGERTLRRLPATSDRHIHHERPLERAQGSDAGRPDQCVHCSSLASAHAGRSGTSDATSKNEAHITTISHKSSVECGRRIHRVRIAITLSDHTVKTTEIIAGV